MPHEIEPEDHADLLTAKVPLDPAAGNATGGGSKMPLPGLIFIGLYMLVLAAMVTFGAVQGHFPLAYLIFAALFVTAGFGLVRLFRWAWALSLAAVFLLMCYNAWLFSSTKMMEAAVQGGLNLIVFLYLVRAEVRSGLR
jgi:hypothetical protein